MGVVVFLSAVAQGTFSQSSTHLVNVEGIHLKGALQALVYSKALRLCVWNITDHKDDSGNTSQVGGSDSAAERASGGCENKPAKGTDMGAITNLMSEDAFNVMSFFWIGHYVWAIPLKIGVLMYLLYLKLGWSAIIGAAFCILVMTPLQFLIGKNMSSNSKAITDLSDERLRKMNEVLQGIKLLKLYGWECIYRRKIMETRQRELKLLDKDSLYWALLTFLTHASSVLVTLVTFGVYFKMVGGALSPGAVFAGLALFNQLTVPLFIFPITVPVVINALVSTHRLEDFLALPETAGAASTADPRPSDSGLTESKVAQVTAEVPRQKPEVVESNHSQDDSVFGLGNIMEGEEDPETEDLEEESGSKVVVTVSSASFSWSGEAERVSLSLKNITFSKGKLTVIVGRVGSGKSSVLSALLGEMHVVSGRVKWAEGSTVAYVAQKPWLLNGTLRDNILFGQKYRPRRYRRIISACALQPDIDILPGKDYTEIGEKGINLSGGQKQRIAIARAMYSEANVVILDDPLSALDYQVGQQVFEQGIKRFLLRQKRTVILVTHSLQLLPYAHKIVVMEGGGVRAQGSLSELEQTERQLVGGWRGAMSREALEGQSCAPGRTAKERWRLVKLVSRIGVQLKQRNVVDGTWQTEEEAHVTPPLFTPLRKRTGTSFGSRHLAHDLPLPIDECEADFVERNSWYRSSLRRHRAATTTEACSQHQTVLRASSLQTGRNDSLPYPVVRQFSSPSMHHDKLPATNRARTYTVDSPSQGSLLRKLFSPSQSRRTLASAPEGSGSFRERNILKRLMLSYSDKPCVNEESEKMPVKRLLSSASAVSDETNDEDDLYEEAFDLSDGRLMSEEEREYGKISKLIYLEYLCACGVVAGMIYLVSAVVWQGLRVYTDYWLSQWTQAGSVVGAQIKYYLMVYAALSVASILLSLSSNAIGQYAGAQARRTLHDKMLCNILYCPMRFFESTPVGRVINRFSTDMGVIDKKLATSIQRLLQFLLLCFSAIFVNAVVTLWFLLLAVLICVVYYLVQHFYRCSSRELQRLDSITRSPIFSHFSETLTGLTTIRAFGHQQRFMDLLLGKMDVHTNAFLIMNTANRWLGIALDYLGAAIVFVAVLTALVTATVYPGLVTPALVGLAVNYTLLIPIYLNWVVKFLADMEMYMGAVERVRQYAKTPVEDYRRAGTTVPSSWPEKGDILFENVSLRYDKNRDPVITNLNLHIPAGQKVSVCLSSCEMDSVPTGSVSVCCS
ncbi:ATP-binding cassette sub-family C member Sur isoform X2 [Bacillus rossius redtenbacheri]|uniref:ATP-binding cassette sub-family C member Sur isoform X2 n=1 Tax=Bacillus rossius redtenbacheri TaxID=93214 RepID=UPI002FDEA885